LASESFVSGFDDTGYLGPVRLFDAAECRRIAAYLSRGEHPAPADWMKGRAVHERCFYELGARPSILSLVTPILGPDVLLWGASAVSRGPGDIHPWHSDIESSAPDGRFVSVWVGIENTSRESALQVITRSHRLGRTVQESRMARGLRRDEATPDAMLTVVREIEPDAELVQPDMTDGDALVFDGRLWHGSDNTRREGRRVALLLQYAAVDCPVRIPDFSQLDWPFRHLPTPLPPTILVAGTDGRGPNRLVPPPPPISKGQPMLSTAVHRVALPLEAPPEPWVAVPGFRGPTRTLADMACHASALVAGHVPHPPHQHVEEELLIPLHGEVELTIPRGPDDPSPRVERIRPGSFVYYPGGQYHTIRNPGPAPVGYLMFKWRAGASDARSPLGTTIASHGELAAPADAPPFWSRVLFEGPTGLLGKLHAHLTVLAPGGGYEPHVDAYDVAIVVLSGTIETLGQSVGPDGVIYCSAGEPHGMRNTGTEPARYLVFEFHTPGMTAEARDAARAAQPIVIRAARKVLRPAWRRIRPYLP